MPKKESEKLIVYTDGGSRGNPGPAALGVVISDQKGNLIKEYGEALGGKTNKEAEYAAVMFSLVFLGFLLGMLRFSIFENKIAADKLHNYYGQTLILRGKVLSSVLKPNSSRITLETDLGRILIIKRIYPEYKYGDVLEISGKVAEPENYAGFDTAKFLAKQQIYSQMIFPEIKKTGHSPNKFLNSLFFIKNKFEESLKSILPEPEASLASGMLLGIEGVIPQGILDNFRKAGVIHILVLSGYNITVVGGK